MIMLRRMYTADLCGGAALAPAGHRACADTDSEPSLVDWLTADHAFLAEAGPAMEAVR